MKKFIFILSVAFVFGTLSSNAQEVATKSTSVKTEVKKVKKTKKLLFQKWKVQECILNQKLSIMEL